MRIGFVLLVLAGQLHRVAAEYADDQPSAVLWKDQLFVAVGQRWHAPGFVWRGTFAPTRKGVRSPSEYENLATTIFGFQAKLDIRENRILLFGDGLMDPRILGMADLQLLERNDFGEALILARGPAGHFSEWEINGDSHSLLFPPHRKPDVPAPPVPLDPSIRASTPEEKLPYWERAYPERARFDVQLAGPKSVRLFHAYKDRLFVSVEPDYLRSWYRDPATGDPIKNPPKPRDRQLRAGRLPAELTGHFAAYTAGGRDYLVTNTGKVYTAAPKGQSEVDVSAIWTDPKRAIMGVVQDQEKDAVYGWGFVTDRAAPERFYVKLDPKPVAVEYKLTVPRWGERADAYLESYECARAFRKAVEKK